MARCLQKFICSKDFYEVTLLLSVVTIVFFFAFDLYKKCNFISLEGAQNKLKKKKKNEFVIINCN